jgi:hypothetical protein
MAKLAQLACVTLLNEKTRESQEGRPRPIIARFWLG